jgi:RimJ/RimL family protein N-acetyltransferase
LLTQTNTLFETERLIVRPFDLDDGAFILKLLNTPSWLKFIGDRSVYTPADARKYLTDGPLKSYAANGFGVWMVSRKTDNTPIGMSGLLKREFLGHPDIGFALLPEFESQGYGSEVLTAALNYTKYHLQIPDLFAFTQRENTRSIRLLERSGFRFKEWIQPPGEEFPLLLYSIDLHAAPQS